jgi:hypothetical protein
VFCGFWKHTRPSHWLFPDPDPSKPVTTRFLQRASRWAADAAGLESHVRVAPCGIASPPISSRVVSVRVIQDLLGHRQITSTTRYARVALDMVPQDTRIDHEYYEVQLPVLDQQLALAGWRAPRMRLFWLWDEQWAVMEPFMPPAIEMIVLGSLVIALALIRLFPEFTGWRNGRRGDLRDRCLPLSQPNKRVARRDDGRRLLCRAKRKDKSILDRPDAGNRHDPVHGIGRNEKETRRAFGRREASVCFVEGESSCESARRRDRG